MKNIILTGALTLITLPAAAASFEEIAKAWSTMNHLVDVCDAPLTEKGESFLGTLLKLGVANLTEEEFLEQTDQALADILGALDHSGAELLCSTMIPIYERTWSITEDIFDWSP